MSSLRGLSVSSRALANLSGLAAVALFATSSMGVGIETIFTKFAGPGTSVVPGAVDINGAPTATNWLALESVVLAPGGTTWLVKGRTNLGSDLENVVVKGAGTSGTMFFQEGQTAPGGGANDRFEYFGPSSSTSPNAIGRFDSSGNFAFSAHARDGASGTLDAANPQRIYKWDGTGFSIVTKQNDPLTGVLDLVSQPGGGASGDEIAGGALGSVSLLDNGNVGFMDASMVNIAFTMTRGLFYHNSTTGVNAMYHQVGGIDTVTNITNTGTNTFTFSTGIATDRFVTTPNGAHAMFIGTAVGSPSRSVLVRDNRVIVQNGVAPAPGVLVAGVMTNFELLPNGHWTAWGTYNAAGGFWALKDGYLIARTGDPIFPGSTELWGSGIRFAVSNRNGDVLVAGNTNAASSINEVLVLNGTTVLLRKGSMVDANNNNIDDDNVFIGRASTSNTVLLQGAASDDNYIYFLSTIRNGAGADLNGTSVAYDPNAFLRLHFAGSCGPADFDHSGVVDFFDYLDFVDAFSQGILQADFNVDGTVDFFDYLDFVDVFSIGC